MVRVMFRGFQLFDGSLRSACVMLNEILLGEQLTWLEQDQS